MSPPLTCERLWGNGAVGICLTFIIRIPLTQYHHLIIHSVQIGFSIVRSIPVNEVQKWRLTSLFDGNSE